MCVSYDPCSNKLTRVDAGFSDIPDSSSLNNVADDELLDGLVLGNTTSAVGAANGIGVAAAVFGSSVIAAFAGLKMLQAAILENQHYLF